MSSKGFTRVCPRERSRSRVAPPTPGESAKTDRRQTGFPLSRGPRRLFRGGCHLLFSRRHPRVSATVPVLVGGRSSTRVYCRGLSGPRPSLPVAAARAAHSVIDPVVTGASGCITTLIRRANRVGTVTHANRTSLRCPLDQIMSLAISSRVSLCVSRFGHINRILLYTLDSGIAAESGAGSGSARRRPGRHETRAVGIGGPVPS